MKKGIFLSAAIALGIIVQAQELPQASPAATVQQRVGLTDIEINYSRPGVKERKIFGELVPFEQMWRTGANMATTISFSSDVNVAGEDIKAGTYSLFTIPTPDSWAVILNSNTELVGTSGYSEEADVLRLEIEPKECEHVETMRISVENIRSENADIILAWENTSVSIPVFVPTHQVAEANIKAAIDEKPDDWRVYRSAASYYSNNDMDPEMALKHIKRSIELDGSSWFSHYLHAEILLQNGQKDEARRAAEKALQVGQEAAAEAGNEFNYTGMIESFIEKL